ncbi:MAG: hypothetical protein WBQ45_03730 [Roseiarcus sp.]|jgi:hypothetical protein|uniref:hypothetical protein n=2 Tax=Roseiarcus sp. TaxID=1969460 RepID=UPI003BB039D2
MKAGLLIVAVGAALASATGPSHAGLAGGIQFGAPDYSNYLSRPGVVTCDWKYPNYFRACPTPQLPPKPEPVPTRKPAHS